MCWGAGTDSMSQKQLHFLFVLLCLVSAADETMLHAKTGDNVNVLEVFDPSSLLDGDSAADGIVVTDLINIDHGMQMTVGTDASADRELELLRELRSETQELINRHTHQLQEYDERIARIEAQRNYVKIGVSGEQGAAEFISGGFEEGGERSMAWWLRDVASSKTRKVGAAPHVQGAAPATVSINSTARTPGCTPLKQNSHAIVELSAFCLDYAKRELIRFEHHEHPNVTSITVAKREKGTLIDMANEHLLGMCLHEQREILMPAQQAFGHPVFNDMNLPVPRNCTIMLRLHLLHFSELKHHEDDIARLDKAVKRLQHQMKQASETRQDAMRQVDRIKAHSMQETREAQTRLDEVVQLRLQEQRERAEADVAKERQKRLDDMANWGALVVGIVVVIARYLSDRRKRQQERAKKMKRTQRLQK